MTERYNHLFSSIVTSSIWVADPSSFKVWIAMLAMADSDGCVPGTIPGFANLCGITVEQMEAAEAMLLDPDKWSRTPDNDGRRIERIEGGWKLLNYDRYNSKVALDKNREKARQRKQRQRAKSRNVTQCHGPVTAESLPTNHKPQTRNQKDINPPTPQRGKEPSKSECEIPEVLLAVPGFREAWGEWELHRRQKRQRLTPLTMGKQLAWLATIPGDAVAVINRSIEKGWQGLFPLDKGPPGLSTNSPPSTPDYPSLE